MRRFRVVGGAVFCSLLLLACSDDTDERADTPTSTTASPDAMTTASVGATTTTEPAQGGPTWTGEGFAALEWGADRVKTIAAMSELIGPPTADRPGECGQYAQWDDPSVLLTFTDEGRFGGISFDLTDFSHTSGVTVGDPLGELQAAEPSGTWLVFGTDGSSASTGPQTWTLRRGDVVTLGRATAPVPDGTVERPMTQYSTSFDPPPCGD